jgi:hypothetical protein
MARLATLLSPSITSAEALPSGARVTACCGTSRAVAFTPSCSTARTYMPGISSLSGLGTTARSVTLPVPASTVTPLKVRRPGCGYLLPSSSTSWMRASASLARCSRPLASSRFRRSSSLLDCVTCTWIGSSCCTVVITAAWLAVTSAPGVTADSSAQPVMGEVMRV